MTSNDGVTRAVAVAGRDVLGAVEAVLLQGPGAPPHVLANLARGHTAQALLDCASSLGINLREDRQAFQLLCLAGMM